LESLAGVAGHGHQAVELPDSELKRHDPMNTSHSTGKGKRGSAAQSHAWGTFGGASCGWGTLTEDQYRAWEEAAKQEKRRRHWPPSRRFTGQNLFTEINAHQRFLRLPPFLYPPERPVFGPGRPGPLTAGDGSDWFPLNLGVPKMPAGHTLVFGSPPCPAGRRVCRDFRFLGLLPPPEGGVSELTWQYVAKFGSPQPGSRIFIRTWQQIDGWREPFPTQFTVIIPGKPAPAARRRRHRATGMA
jgi:hypothetical protein